MQNQPFEFSSVTAQDQTNGKTTDAGDGIGAQTSVNLIDIFLAERQSKLTNKAMMPLVEAGVDRVALNTTSTDQTDAQKPKECPTSPVYNEHIEHVARSIFDLTVLGDLKTLKTKYNCDIQKNGDPIKYFRKALQGVDKDPYTYYMT